MYYTLSLLHFPRDPLHDLLVELLEVRGRDEMRPVLDDVSLGVVLSDSGSRPLVVLALEGVLQRGVWSAPSKRRELGRLTAASSVPCTTST